VISRTYCSTGMSRLLLIFASSKRILRWFVCGLRRTVNSVVLDGAIERGDRRGWVGVTARATEADQSAHDPGV
jgi:hypothetical protein